MTPVTVHLQPHHVRALVDARIKLTLLHQLGVDFSQLCDALDEIVQMCSENRERVPLQRLHLTDSDRRSLDRYSVRADSDRQLTPADLRSRGLMRDEA